MTYIVLKAPLNSNQPIILQESETVETGVVGDFFSPAEVSTLNFLSALTPLVRRQERIRRGKSAPVIHIGCLLCTSGVQPGVTAEKKSSC